MSALDWSTYINDNTSYCDNDNIKNELLKTNDYINNVEDIYKDIANHIKFIDDINITDEFNNSESSLLTELKEFEICFTEKIKMINTELMNYENNDSIIIKNESIQNLISLLFNKNSNHIELNASNILMDKHLKDKEKTCKFVTNYFNKVIIENEIENENENDSGDEKKEEVQKEDIDNLFMQMFILMKRLKSIIININQEIYTEDKVIESKLKIYKEILKNKESCNKLIIDENTDEDSVYVLNKLFTDKIKNINLNNNLDKIKDLIISKKKYNLLYDILHLSRSNSLLCSICLCEGDFVVIVPCGHTCCTNCMLKINKCHVCRISNVSFQKIYFN
jgi:hypothetical protein